MKLLIRDYLASLRERDELDAILPDLLSELGFTVYSRPRRGTSQQGVDIAAVGQDDDGERKVFLFSVKQGDLTRQDWNGSTVQALRPSLDEIIDAYIPSKIPTKYRNLKIVICLTFGGDVHEQVRQHVAGYIERNTTDKITFDEWNGDKIAGLILKGILREEILPKALRSSFQKAVAMIDEPEVSYQYFRKLVNELRVNGKSSNKARVRSARQINICLWILFVWARDAENIESAYRGSELALLSVWDLLRPTIGKQNKEAKDLGTVLAQLIVLHLTVATEFIDKRIRPFAPILHGISRSVGARSALDVNLALFEVLGRLSLCGLWLHWLSGKQEYARKDEGRQGVVELTDLGLMLIRNNPALHLPITDRQTTDISLFLQLWLVSGRDNEEVTDWLADMAGRLDFAVRTRGNYPSCSSDYRDLAEHPRDRSDEYFEEATAGSTLLPVLTAWLSALGQTDTVAELAKLVAERMEHCTLQLWSPDASSEEGFYIGDDTRGTALTNLGLGSGGSELLKTISEAIRRDNALNDLSAFKTGYWPLVFLACRHHQMPVPPGFWVDSLLPASDKQQANN